MCGTSPEYARWNLNQRSALGRQLAARVPSLINADGLMSIDGVRNRPAVLQREQAAAQPTDRGQHGRRRDRDPGGVRDARVGTAGRDERRAAGCLTSPGGRSPATRQRRSGSTCSRATSSTVNPSAAEGVPDADLMPNTLFSGMTWHSPRTRRSPRTRTCHPVPNSPNALVRAVSRGMQAQMADFHASGGTIVNTPTPTELWEVPIVASSTL